MYQTPVNTTAPPGYVHNKYKTVPCKNYQLGYCKYGDRCTFAHGDVDMRAKFVPASSLYPSTPPEYTGEAVGGPTTSVGVPAMGTLGVPMTAPGTMYSGIDYSVFGASQESFQNFGSQDQMYQSQNVYNGYGMDEYNGPSVSGKTSNYQNEQLSYFNQAQSQETNGAKQETSKFGFGYDSLTESIDELELVDSNDSETFYAMSAVKNFIKSGKVEQAEIILKELLENRKIEYKHMSLYFGSSIFNAFGSSEAN